MAKAESSTTLDELLEQCTVKLNVPGKRGWGTGFFVAPGQILTCAHVVKDAGGKPVQVIWANQPTELEATVTGVFSDPYDLALLELKQPISGHPCVYLDNAPKTDRAIQSGDELYTYGYPDDFSNGAPVTALCEGVTGDQPPVIKFKAGQVRPGLSGSPLLNRRTQKVCGIVKFTRDRSDDLGGGAIPVAAIFSKFNELVEQQTKFHKRDLRWSTLLPLARCRLRTVLFSSLGMAVVIALLRVFGALQGLELKTYDHLLKIRPADRVDDRIRVIAISDEDILEQEKSEEIVGATSISNRLLAELLLTLEGYQPLVIGLDLYREEPLSPEVNSELIKFYETQPNLITLCKVSTKPGGVDSIKAPPGARSNQVGFSDLSVDGDNVLRRSLLAFPPDESSTCQADTSFSFNVASHYLKQTTKGFRADPLISGETCNALTFYSAERQLFTQQFLTPSTGGYQGDPLLLGGCQVLLDYRKPEQIAESYSLMSVVGENSTIPASEFKDRIVLIGVVSTKKYVDYVQTPFGISDDQQMAGVFAQAQMISQLLRAAEGDRAFILVLPLWGEWLAIFVWSLMGGVIAWRVQSFQRVILFLGGVFVMTYSVCVGCILFNLWLPLVPLMLGSALTLGIVAWLTFNIKTGSSIGFSKPAFLKQ